MAWTSPRTWTNEELVTASLMNLHVRDNLAFLHDRVASAQAANTVFAGPASGSDDVPGYRALVAADVPVLDTSKLTTGTLPVARGGTNAATATANVVFAGPTSGSDAAPAFRTLVAADHPVVPSFSVHKNGTNQTGIASVVFTKLTWSTEVYDTHGLFASDRFTVTAETAGLYHFIVNPVWYSNEMATDILLVTALYKNGSSYRVSRAFSTLPPAGGVYWGVLLTIHDLAVAGDYYEVYVRHSDTADRTIYGSATNTYWTGTWMGRS